MQATRLSVFKHFVEAIKEPHLRAHGRRALAAGRVSFEDPTLAVLLHSLNLAIQGVPLIRDLKLVLLRNRTAVPFVLSDAPAVAYNLFAWEYPRRGALGHNSRGPMILMPLTPAVQLVLCNPQVYRFSMEQEPFVELLLDRDVAQLNTLQFYAAQENVYFADNGSTPYVTDLYRELKPKMNPLPSGFIEHPTGTMLIDGAPNDGELIMNYEPQLPYRMRLSVLRYGSAPCEAAVTCGRHGKNSPEYQAFKSDQKGPFPEVEFPSKIVWLPPKGRRSEH